MSGRCIPFLREVVLLAAAFLLIGPEAQAGGRVVTSGGRSPQAQPQPQPAPAPVVHVAARPVSISITVAAPAPPAGETEMVNLRGPDGQLRSFPIEGGTAAIQYRQVTLRPGQSVTIRLAAR